MCHFSNVRSDRLVQVLILLQLGPNNMKKTIVMKHVIKAEEAYLRASEQNRM